MSNIFPAAFGFGVLELPRPDQRPPRRAHDTLVDHRPAKGRRRRG
jgi:hypothetical protein